MVHKINESVVKVKLTESVSAERPCLSASTDELTELPSASTAFHTDYFCGCHGVQSAGKVPESRFR